MTQNQPTKTKPRSYSVTTQKILWGSTGGVCCFPGCKEIVIRQGADGTMYVNADIAHIYAFAGDRGARGNPNKLSDTQLNEPENLIILCRNHHSEVDEPANATKYPAPVLFGWKKSVMKRIESMVASGMSEVTFSELDIVTKAIVARASVPSSDLSITPIMLKMEKNGLVSDTTLELFHLGAGKSSIVEEFLIHMGLFDNFKFAERLKAGFVAKYTELANEGFNGDDLFYQLHMFARNGSDNAAIIAAGVAVLVHLFQKCEIFVR